jgi:hypothetical protein
VWHVQATPAADIPKDLAKESAMFSLFDRNGSRRALRSRPFFGVQVDS